jgi:hypothetical protein
MISRISFLSLGLFALVATAQAGDSIHVSGGGAASSDVTASQIRSQLAAEIKPVAYRSKGADHTFGCVPLVSVLKGAGVQTDFVMQPGADPKKKNLMLRRVVIITGADGYTVVFSLAELLPSVGNRIVWLAVDEDGKPLPEKEAPMRLIVPDDKMPARAVHQVASIDVEEISAPTTQPANP